MLSGKPYYHPIIDTICKFADKYNFLNSEFANYVVRSKVTAEPVTRLSFTMNNVQKGMRSS